MIDLFTRECLAIDAGDGLSRRDVVATPECLRFERGLLQRIYCDNGSEFVSAAMDLWAYSNGVSLDFSIAASRRTRPPSNRSTEECLNVDWFASLEDAKQPRGMVGRSGSIEIGPTMVQWSRIDSPIVALRAPPP